MADEPTRPPAEDDGIAVRHVPERRRYVLVDDDAGSDDEGVIGTAHYLPFDDAAGPQRVFFHTIVDDAFGGRGLGGRLVRAALDDTIAAGATIVAVCPFVRAYLERHPELATHATAPQARHLAALPDR